MTRDELIDFFSKSKMQWMRTGSRYICNPAPTDTDEDFIVICDGGIDYFLEASGFVRNTDPEKYESMPDFYAWRNGVLNVVVTTDQCFFDRFCAATELAKSRNILAKNDRIALFQSILYGVTQEQNPVF